MMHGQNHIKTKFGVRCLVIATWAGTNIR